MLNSLLLLQSDVYLLRDYVGKLDATYTTISILPLGGYSRMKPAADCTGAVLRGEPELTLVYSSDRFHPLNDMIHKHGSIFYAFQVTLCGSHDAK